MEAYETLPKTTVGKTTTFLSIIIPVLNDAIGLANLLPFIKKHAAGQEIIVVDAAASIDNAAEVAEKHNVAFVKSVNCGRAIQMNQGAKIASGNVLMFLHADVLPPPNFVENISEAIDNGSRAGFFAYKFEPSTRWLDINARYTAKDGLFAGGGDQCQFMTKDVFEDLGAYDERYVIMEDFALIRKIKKKDIPLSIIQDRATVSSRKYSKNSYLWVNIVNLVVFLAFLLGVSPKTLKKMYSFSLK